MLCETAPDDCVWSTSPGWFMSKLRFTTQAAIATNPTAASASRGGVRRPMVALGVVAGQLATDPAETSIRWTRESESWPQNSREDPDLAVSVTSGRHGAPGNARERTLSSIDASAVWVQWRRD